MRNALITVLLPLAACTLDVSDPRLDVDLDTSERSAAVVDGTAAVAGQVGATVSLFDPAYNESFCTGTLIAPQVVVTAAHCLFLDSVIGPDDVVVITGALVAAEAPASQQHAVTAVIPHEDFSQYGSATTDPDGLADERDIGVLLLAQPVASVTPATVLPFADVDLALPENTPITVAGYGMTESTGGDYGRLYIAETPYKRRASSEFLAGGAGEPDTCGGDSGGSAYVDYLGERFVFGATSRAAASSTEYCSGGGIYTLVSAYGDWIEEQAGDLFDGDDGGAMLPPPQDPPAGGTCESRCGAQWQEGDACGCDADCVSFGDCCADFEARCGDDEPRPDPPADPGDDMPVDDPADDKPGAPGGDAVVSPDVGDDPLGAQGGEDVAAAPPGLEPTFDPTPALSCSQTTEADAVPALCLFGLLAWWRRRRRPRRVTRARHR